MATSCHNQNDFCVVILCVHGEIHFDKLDLC